MLFKTGCSSGLSQRGWRVIMKVNLCIQFQNDSEAGAGITSGDIASVDCYYAVLVSWKWLFRMNSYVVFDWVRN